MLLYIVGAKILREAAESTHHFRTTSSLNCRKLVPKKKDSKTAPEVTLLILNDRPYFTELCRVTTASDSLKTPRMFCNLLRFCQKAALEWQWKLEK